MSGPHNLSMNAIILILSLKVNLLVRYRYKCNLGFSAVFVINELNKLRPKTTDSMIAMTIERVYLINGSRRFESDRLTPSMIAGDPM